VTERGPGVKWRPLRPAILGALLLLLPLLTSCSRETPSAERSIVVGLEANPTSLDPRHATGAAAVRIVPLVFNSLVRLDTSGQIVPEAALSWDNPSPTEYVFTLRRDIRFHDGEPLTSRDVKYTYDYMRDPDKGSPNLGVLANVTAVEAPEPDKVIFRLEEPFASFLNNLTLGIVPAHLGEGKGFMDAPVGSGPFRWGEWQVGSKIVLFASDDYWEGRPALDEVVFRIIENETTRLLETEKGEIDLLWNNIPPYAVEKVRGFPGMNVHTRPGITYQYLGFNLEDPTLGDVRVRRAIAHAIDRERIIRHLYGGLGRTASGILAPENWAHEAEVRTYPFDREKARSLLDEAGYPPGEEGRRFTLVYKTSTNRQANETADIIAEDLAAVGINVERRSFEWGTFYGDIKAGNFQLYSLRWVGLTDPDTLHYIFHSGSLPPTGANRGRYRSAKVDDLLDRSRLELDPLRRKALFSQVQKVLAEDSVYVSLWYPDDIFALSDRFEGFEAFPGGQYTSLKKVRLKGVSP
jgi:peptide/nickel transport system substrate-binding protein